MGKAEKITFSSDITLKIVLLYYSMYEDLSRWVQYVVCLC